jgi:hypothetical protein
MRTHHCISLQRSLLLPLCVHHPIIVTSNQCKVVRSPAAIMNEDLSSKKRPAEEKSQDEESSSSRPLKRACRADTIENFIPTPAKKFLLLHLQILRAVYDDTDAQNDEDTPLEDGTVDQENWNIIQNFLKEREGIQCMFDQVQSCQGVHEEAVQFIHEQREEIMLSASCGDWATAHAVTAPSMLRSSSLLFKTQPSPHGKVPRFSASSSLLSAAARDDEDVSNQSESFGLIAALLRQKYDIANDMLTEKTNPYRKLLQDVRRRLAILGELRRKEESPPPSPSKEAAGENNNNESSRSDETRTPDKRLRLDDFFSRQSQDSNEESLARLDTKLRLWKLLLNDLARSTR